MILNTFVLWAHIFGAIGWVGAGMVFAIVIGPSLAKMSPQARTEFFAKVMPRYTRYIAIFSVLTILMGIAMVGVMADGDYSMFSPSSGTFGLLISTGAILAIITIGLAMSLILPTARKMSVIAQSLLQNPGPPPPEFPALAKRLRIGSTLALVLLIVITIAMVGAATA